MIWPSPTEALVLREVLKLGECYGLQIVNGSSIARGTVYVVLGRLEAKGLIESQLETRARDGYIGIPRRLYKATKLGRKCRQALEALSSS